MPIEQIIILAIVQGISEFLPISSSAHLVLVPYLTNWQDQGLAVDIMIHLGSLLAVLVYFRKDVAKMILGLGLFIKGKKNKDAQLALFIILATIPAIIVGSIMQFIAPHNPWRNIELIAYNSIIFATVLFFADKFGKQNKTINDLQINSVLIIGIAQALALMPGVSRSGITISAARLLGFARLDAAKFSFLLSIVAISLAGIFASIQQNNPMPDGAILAAILSFFTAILAIWILMTIIKHLSFLVFVIYRLLLGIILLTFIYL